MSRIGIRRADWKDVEGLSRLFRDFIGRDSDRTAMAAQVERINRNPQYYVAVASDDSEVVGTAMGIVCYDLVGVCRQFMLIENVVVLPAYQRQGVGRMLMNELEAFAKQQDCKSIILVSEIERGASHRFYEALGYASDQAGFKKSL